jgi:CRP/FNR family transcriptional regulator, cyclic AMP receptor protein
MSMLMVQVLRNTELFSPFSAEELALLLEFCQEQRIPKGTTLFAEGQKDDCAVYLVQEGVIKIVKGEDSARILLAMFGLGNIFGEMSFLDSGPRSATAVTDEESVVFKLTPDQFYEYGVKAPKAAMKMFKVFISKLVRRLRETDEALVSKSKKIIIS